MKDYEQIFNDYLEVNYNKHNGCFYIIEADEVDEFGKLVKEHLHLCIDNLSKVDNFLKDDYMSTIELMTDLLNQLYVKVQKTMDDDVIVYLEYDSNMDEFLTSLPESLQHIEDYYHMNLRLYVFG